MEGPKARCSWQCAGEGRLCDRREEVGSKAPLESYQFLVAFISKAVGSLTRAQRRSEVNIGDRAWRLGVSIESG